MAEWNINEPTFSIQVGGIILVGAYSSHLGDQLEKARYYRYTTTVLGLKRETTDRNMKTG